MNDQPELKQNSNNLNSSHKILFILLALSALILLAQYSNFLAILLVLVIIAGVLLINLIKCFIENNSPRFEFYLNLIGFGGISFLTSIYVAMEYYKVELGIIFIGPLSIIIIGLFIFFVSIIYEIVKIIRGLISKKIVSIKNDSI